MLTSVRECEVTPTFIQERERLLVVIEKQIRDLDLYLESNFQIVDVTRLNVKNKKPRNKTTNNNIQNSVDESLIHFIITDWGAGFPMPNGEKTRTNFRYKRSGLNDHNIRKQTDKTVSKQNIDDDDDDIRYKLVIRNSMFSFHFHSNPI